MSADRNSIATIAVKDITLARRFYEGILGEKQVRADEAGLLLYVSGSSRIRIRESKTASTNKVASGGWAMGDEIDGVWQSLKGF